MTCNQGFVLKWCKTILALLLLPLCAGAAWALWLVLKASGNADTVWAATLAGAGCWLAVYLLLPKPMLVYVFGHELTHAVWTWLMGGSVKQFKASSEGGHVIVTRNNFLVALAPYFFPLYALLVAGVFGAGRAIWGWQNYQVWFHLLLGAAYAFHLTLTWHILRSDQTDIRDQGYLFSAVIVFLGNVVVLLIGIPLLMGTVKVGQAFSWWAGCTLEVLRRLVHSLPR